MRIFAPFLDGVAHERLDLGDRRAVDQRADIGAGRHARSDSELLDRVDESGSKAVVDAGLHQDAVGADAGLAGIAVFGGHGAGDRLVEIGVVEDKQRRIAAKLEGELLHRIGALPVEDLADLGRAGEGELADAAVLTEDLADCRRIGGGDDVEHAGRQTGIERELGDRQRTERRLLGGLDHDGASRRERRAQLSA